MALPDGERPGTLISQSATGFYGPSDDRRLDETAPSGSDFLAGVVAAWEHEALLAEAKMRVVRTRTGVVLTREGGALAQMLPFFRLGLGGPVAGGRQYVPWVHLDDVVSSMLWCLDATGASGAVNVTAPEPVTNADFSHALGRALGRPAVLPVPGFALRLLYGEMAEIVTTGQRVVPAALGSLGLRLPAPGDRSGAAGRPEAFVTPTTLLWLRRDLRLHDHPALHAAARGGAIVVPVFCFDDRLLRGRHASGARTQFLLDCLADLRASAGRTRKRTDHPPRTAGTRTAGAGARTRRRARTFHR